MTDDRKFRDVVESIVTAEDDVDKILKAARLTRQEKANALTAEYKFWLGVIALCIIGLAVVVGAMCLGSYIRVLRYR